jgi:hypothetical protein
MCVIGIACGSVVGCGETPKDAERARALVPGATSIDCTRQANGSRCAVLAGRPPGGLKAWTCEFTYQQGAGQVAYSGTDSCWSDRGR